MEIRFRDSTADRIKSDLVVIPVRDKQLDDPALRALDRHLKGQLRARMSKGNFTSTEGSVLLHPTAGTLPAAHLLLIGIGAGEITGDTWRKTGAKARKEAGAIGAGEFAMLLAAEKNLESAAGAIVEGAALAGYQFNKYRSNGKPAAALKSLTLFRSGLRKTSALQKSVDIAQTTAPGVFLARDLVNEPPSVATAKFLGIQAQRACQGRGLSVQVWNKKKIESMKLAGLLAVNRGSLEEPRFIRIHYRPAGKARKRVALIGKGITFDSGGLSLKPSKSMETMKLDMAGGAAVIATM
ncbi:MAG: hypothetical protein M3N35_09140, partial [Candidatus Binatota bacterium]|nr:hypothetical protein [Candidatus Binatota bacterium]